MLAAIWLPRQDSNLGFQLQRLTCCRYTMGQSLRILLCAAGPLSSRRRAFPVAFIFRWFGYKMGVQCPPYPPPEMRRYGTATPPGNPTGAPCDQSRLAMHRHHRYARANATGYGEVRVQIPVFRCGHCRRMASVMPLLGDEMRHRRFSKKTVMPPSAWPRRD